MLARAEIPSHIPRPDFLKQIYIWATQHCAEAQKTYGVIMEVDTVDEKQADGEDLTVAFTISLLKFVDDKCANFLSVPAEIERICVRPCSRA